MLLVIRLSMLQAFSSHHDAHACMIFIDHLPCMQLDNGCSHRPSGTFKQKLRKGPVADGFITKRCYIMLSFVNIPLRIAS